MKFSFRFLTPVLAAVGLALASAPAALAAEATGEPIRIPMMESFSGAAADWGEDMWTGAVAAQKIINMRGGIKGRPLEFYKADAPYDDLPTAVSMFKKLARDPNVTMIFDGGATSVIAAVHDLTGDAKLPLFAFSSGGFWRMGHFNPWVFRALPQAYTALPVLLPKAKNKFGIKKAALIYTHDDEAEVANAIVWRDLAKQNGIELIEVTAKVKDTDFSAQVNEIAGISQNNEVVFSAALGFQVTALRGQLEGQGLDELTYIGTDALDATGIQVEDNNEGIAHTPHTSISPGDRIDTMLADFEAAKGEALESRGFMALYVDSMFLGIQGILDCGCTNPADIGAAVAQIEGFEGLTGVITFAGTNGIPPKAVPINRIVDGVDTLVATIGG